MLRLLACEVAVWEVARVERQVARLCATWRVRG